MRSAGFLEATGLWLLLAALASTSCARSTSTAAGFGGAARQSKEVPLAASVHAGKPGQEVPRKKCTRTTQECLDSMKAKMKAAGWVGIEYEADEATGRVMVERVVPGSPAERAGLQENDILVAMNGIEIKKDNERALGEVRKSWKPGETVRYTIQRGGQAKRIDIVLGEWPADLLGRYIGEHMLEHAGDAATPPPAPPK